MNLFDEYMKATEIQLQEFKLLVKRKATSANDTKRHYENSHHMLQVCQEFMPPAYKGDCQNVDNVLLEAKKSNLSMALQNFAEMHNTKAWDI